VVAEVISPDTRRVDEGEKREAYLTIPTLRAYLLIDSDRPRVVVYRRGDQGFALEEYTGLGAVVSLAEVEAERPLADLYERVEFPASGGI
jgi:Uma2 family endonuclease